MNNYTAITIEFRTKREADFPERARGVEQFPIREHGDDYADIAYRALSAIAIRDACNTLCGTFRFVILLTIMGRFYNGRGASVRLLKCLVAHTLCAVIWSSGSACLAARAARRLSEWAAPNIFNELHLHCISWPTNMLRVVLSMAAVCVFACTLF